MLIKIIKKNNKLKFLIFFLVGNNWNYYFSSNSDILKMELNNTFMENLKQNFNISNALLKFSLFSFIVINKNSPFYEDINPSRISFNQFVIALIFLINLYNMFPIIKKVSWIKLIINGIICGINIFGFVFNPKAISALNDNHYLYLYFYLLTFIFYFPKLINQITFIFFYIFFGINAFNNFTFYTEIIRYKGDESRYNFLYNVCLFMFIFQTINEIIFILYKPNDNSFIVKYKFIYCLLNLIIHNYKLFFQEKIKKEKNHTSDEYFNNLEKYLFIIIVNIYFINYLYKIDNNNYNQLNNIFNKFFFQKLNIQYFFNLLFFVFSIEAIIQFIFLNILSFNINANINKHLEATITILIKDIMFFINLFFNYLYTKIFPILSFNYYLMHNIKKNILFFSKETIKINNIKDCSLDSKKIYNFELLFYDGLMIVFQLIYCLLNIFFDFMYLNINNLSYIMFLYLLLTENKNIVNNINNISNYSIIEYARQKNLPIEKTFNDYNINLNNAIKELIGKEDNIFSYIKND